MLQEVAEGIHRLGGRHHSFYLIVEGGKATVIDAGGSNDLRKLERALKALGMVMNDVEAVLVTHAHTDPIGFAALADKQGIPVKSHEDEIAFMQDRSAGSQFALTDLPLWKPRVWLFLAEMVRAGAQRGYVVPGVEGVSDGESLDLPGRPRVAATPGHTDGHASYLLEDKGVLFSGDALVTMSFVRGGVGPQFLDGFAHRDPDRAWESLDTIAGLGTDLLLPGHGNPWSGPIADLVAGVKRQKRR